MATKLPIKYFRAEDSVPRTEESSANYTRTMTETQTISDGGSGLPHIENKEGHKPRKRHVKKKDFFKIYNNEEVDYEQNDQTIKQLYQDHVIKRNYFGYGSRSHQVGESGSAAMRSKSVQRTIHQQVTDLQKVYSVGQKKLSVNQEMGSLQTDYDEFIANQKIFSKKTMIDHALKLQQFKNTMHQELNEVTELDQSRRTLFSTIVNQQNARVKFHSKEAIIQKLGTGLVNLFRAKNKKQSVYMVGGKLVNSQHLLEMGKKSNDTKERTKQVQNASNLYIPAEKRKFKTKLKKAASKADVPKIPLDKVEDSQAKKVQFDLEGLAKELQNIKDKQRKRKTKKTLKQLEEEFKNKPRRASFSEGQMKYDDAKFLWHPLREKTGTSMKDVVTIKKMRRNKRYPVPERLINVPADYTLFIDSIITQAYNSDYEMDFGSHIFDPEVKVPDNSSESQEEFDFESSGSSMEDMIPQPQTRKEKKEAKKKVKVSKDSLQFNGFNYERMKPYPHLMKEGDIPNYLMDHTLEDNFALIDEKLTSRIRKEHKERNFFPTFDHLKRIYEHHCVEYNCQPINIEQYYSKNTLHFKGIYFPDSQIKAMCCVIPLIWNIKHIKFEKNNLSDEMAAPIMIAAFMNPEVKKLSFINNFLRATSANTFMALAAANPFKIYELDVKYSVQVGDHCDSFTFDLHKQENLHTICLQGNPLSMATCKNLGHFLINSQLLKNLDVSLCNIKLQGTRYIIDGVNRNQGLQYFNFSSNDMSSKIYEFSVKLAKILTRHQHLMHLDISGTGLRKEEVLFIAMAVSSSKSCIALHLSANNLDYYERIFLRTLVSAKVAYHFRNLAQEQGHIRSQKERKQISDMHNHDFDNEQLRDFVRQWNFIDQQRLGLDEEINQILKDVDITEIFRQLKKGNKSHAESSNMLAELIENIQVRAKELAEQKDKESSMNETKNMFDMDGTMQNFNDLGLYNQDKEGEAPHKRVRDLKAGDDEGDDFWVMQNALKIDRIKKRIDNDEDRQKRARSAGEMALMFMGINKIAYDLMLENPMTGYMNEVILTRVLDSDDIENGSYWKDCSQCFVCELWDKSKIEYHDSDHKHMKQSIEKLGHLHEVLKQFVDLKNKKMIKKLPQSEVKAMYDKEKEEEGEAAEGEATAKVQVEEAYDYDEEYSVTTAPEDRIFTESLFSQKEEGEPAEQQADGRVDKTHIQKQLPKNYAFKQDIRAEKGEGYMNDSDGSDESELADYDNLSEMIRKQAETTEGGEDFQSSQANQMANIEDGEISEQVDESGNGDEGPEEEKEEANDDGEEDKAISEARAKRRQEFEERRKKMLQGKTTVWRGDKLYQIVKKTIFFRGAAFIIEEEISVDSGDETSVRTSEDSFEVDTEAVVSKFGNRMKEKREAKPEDEQKQLTEMAKLLFKNQPNPQGKNIFGRDNIFLVASFNDWLPIELKTFFELKKQKGEEKDLIEAVARAGGQLKGKKREENMPQYTNYISPGKHFFYFVYKREYIFLSPRYDIVRFKGTNVLLNQIKVKERTKPLAQVTLSRSIVQAETAKFNKAKSVFKNFQEDDPEFLKKMLDQDMDFGKLDRLTKNPQDAKDLKKKILQYYLQIKNIFLHIASTSSYPTIGMNDFTSFVHRSELFDKYINLATMDRTLIATNVSVNKYKNSSERELHRYEFVEIIVRLAQKKFKEPGITENLHSATEKILIEHIIPKNAAVDGLNFREEHMYNLRVDEIFKKNELVIRKLYESFLNPNKKYITLEECTKLLKKADVKIHEYKIAPCYAESMMSKIDTLSDLSALQQMKYVEFLVFIARISHEVFKGTKREKKGLHLKIDKLLEPLLETIYSARIFSFKEESEEEESVHDEDDDEDGDEDGSILSGEESADIKTKKSKKRAQPQMEAVGTSNPNSAANSDAGL